MKNERNFIKNVMEKNYSLTITLSKIHRKIKDNDVKVLFSKNVLEEISYIHLSIFSKLSDNDIEELFKCYKTQEPPFFTFSEVEFLKIRHFIRTSSSRLYISNKNIKGFSNSTNGIYKVYKLNEMLIENFNNLDFDDKLTGTKEFKNLRTIFDLEKELTNIIRGEQVLGTNNIEGVEKELHNNIFKGKAFYLFDSYYNNKSMTFQSRTDFRFLFEKMKKDDLIYDTISLNQYIDFIRRYGFVDNELRAIDLESKPNINRAKEYHRYKDDLKTTLK